MANADHESLIHDIIDADVGNVKREHIFGKAWFVISPRDSFGFIKE